MEIVMSNEESEQIFFNALCNGLSEVTSYGLVFSYESAAYNNAKEKLKEEDPSGSRIHCFEDVIIKMLRMGGSISLIEEDGGSDWTITLKEVHERVKNTPIEYLADVINETDDAITADVILQTVFCNEIIYA